MKIFSTYCDLLYKRNTIYFPSKKEKGDYFFIMPKARMLL